MVKFWTSLFKTKKHSSLKKLPKEYVQILGFKPKREDIFWTSLTPKALNKYRKDGQAINYERLEFLGDAILGSIIAEYLYKEAPENDEGYLTKMRSKIVSRKNLNEIGKDLNLSNFIPLEGNKVSLSNNVLGDLVEAMIGAIYSDQGYETTKKFVHRVVIEPYSNLKELEQKIISYKSLMLEWAQKNKRIFKVDTQEEENAERQQVFVCELYIDAKFVSKGRGYNKKKAEEIASKRAYYKLISNA